jgi:uncharacterized protein (DUF488 family)
MIVGYAAANMEREMSSTKPTVFSIGHGTRSLDELVDTLAAAGVEHLVDVRRYPGSRRHPHFAGAALEVALPGYGIAYEWAGEGLGGRREPGSSDSRHRAWRVPGFRAYADYMDTDDFRGALERLENTIRTGPPTAMMCAETLWWRCHRRLIADALTIDGFEVVHLLDPTTRGAHPLHESARVDAHNRPVYDVGVTEQLDI